MSDKSEAVILCEGYDDRAFWAGGWSTSAAGT